MIIYRDDKMRKRNIWKFKINSRIDRQNLQIIRLTDNLLDEKYHWHHIDNNLVATIPEDLHRLYFNGDIIKHRFMCNKIIEQIYGVDLEL